MTACARVSKCPPGANVRGALKRELPAILKVKDLDVGEFVPSGRLGEIIATFQATVFPTENLVEEVCCLEGASVVKVVFPEGKGVIINGKTFAMRVGERWEINAKVEKTSKIFYFAGHPLSKYQPAVLVGSEEEKALRLAKIERGKRKERAIRQKMFSAIVDAPGFVGREKGQLKNWYILVKGKDPEKLCFDGIIAKGFTIGSVVAFDGRIEKAGVAILEEPNGNRIVLEEVAVTGIITGYNYSFKPMSKSQVREISKTLEYMRLWEKKDFLIRTLSEKDAQQLLVQTEYYSPEGKAIASSYRYGHGEMPKYPKYAIDKDFSKWQRLGDKSGWFELQLGKPENCVGILLYRPGGDVIRSGNIRLNNGKRISFSTMAGKDSLWIPFSQKESIANIRVDIIEADDETGFAEILFVSRFKRKNG